LQHSNGLAPRDRCFFFCVSVNDQPKTENENLL
jgi:hypothetical protein